MYNRKSDGYHYNQTLSFRKGNGAQHIIISRQQYSILGMKWRHILFHQINYIVQFVTGIKFGLQGPHERFHCTETAISLIIIQSQVLNIQVNTVPHWLTMTIIYVTAINYKKLSRRAIYQCGNLIVGIMSKTHFQVLKCKQYGMTTKY